MQVKTLLVGIAAMAFVGAANAECVFNNNSGNEWSTAANWGSDCAGTRVPGIDDIARIPSGEFVNVNVTNAICGELVVEPTADVHIATSANGTLTIDTDGDTTGLLKLQASGSGDGEIHVGDADVNDVGILQLKNNNGSSHQMGGVVYLKEADSRLDIVDDNVTFAEYVNSGSFFGSVTGENNTAKIQLSEGRTLRNQITIEGALTIQRASGTATTSFINDRDDASELSGFVSANLNGGTLLLDASIAFSDEVEVLNELRPRWMASGTATLAFDDACALFGNFILLDTATMDFDENVSTEGYLFLDPSGSAVVIDVEAGNTFSPTGPYQGMHTVALD